MKKPISKKPRGIIGIGTADDFSGDRLPGLESWTTGKSFGLKYG